MSKDQISEMLKGYFRSLMHYQYDVKNAITYEERDKAEREFNEQRNFLDQKFVDELRRMGGER